MGLVFADKVEKTRIKSGISCLVGVTPRYITSLVRGIMRNQSSRLQGTNIDTHTERGRRKDNRELPGSHVAESHCTIVFEENFLTPLHRFHSPWSWAEHLCSPPCEQSSAELRGKFGEDAPLYSQR